MAEQKPEVKITLTIVTNKQTVYEEFESVEALWDWLVASDEWDDLLPDWSNP